MRRCLRILATTIALSHIPSFIQPVLAAGASASLADSAFADTTWQATPNLRLDDSSGSQRIQVLDAGTFMGRIPVASGASRVTVSASLRAAPGKGWVALGIGNPQLGSPPWGKGIFVIIAPGGQCSLVGSYDPGDWESKHIIRLKSQNLASLSPGQPVEVRLEFEPAANVVSLRVGAEQVVNRLPLAGRGFQVEPMYAGFSGLGQPSETIVVENFTMTQEGGAKTAIGEVVAVPAIQPAWWRMGQPVHVDLRNTASPEIAAIDVMVTDIDGEPVYRERIPRAKLEQGWSWNPTSPGYYEVAFVKISPEGTAKPITKSFTVNAPGGASRVFERPRQAFAVIPAFAPFTRQVGQFGFTYTLNKENITLAKLIGFDLANIHPIPWGANFTNLGMAIEPAKGEYHWEILDPHIDALRDAGMTIAGQFCYTPLWASPHPEKTKTNICVVEGTTYAPADMADYGRFVEATVKRYGDRIKLWELWNEPAVPGGSVFWADTPENYVRLMETGYTTIKRLQPDANVWIGGLGPRAPYYAFYNKLLALGADKYFDTLSLHGRTTVDAFRRIEQARSAETKPVVMSEWHGILQGNSQSTPILSEPTLSMLLMRSLLLQLKQGVTRSILFEMSNLAEKETLIFAKDNHMFVHSSGLFRRRPQLEPRLPGVVMANFLGQTGRKATFVREFTAAPGAIALLLDTDRGPLVVLWSDTQPVTPSALAGFATSASILTDWEGRPAALRDNGELPAARLYYLTKPDVAKIMAAPAADNLFDEQSRILANRQVAHASYHVGPLFSSVQAPASLPDDTRIDHGWKQTRPTDDAQPFSATAAVGMHPEALDLIIEVRDPVHDQPHPISQAWQGDSIQIAVDCEDVGQPGGNTEFIAAQTADGPTLWKIIAADTRGDIPANWSPSRSVVKHGSVAISREGDLVRYQVRIAWGELYPFVFDGANPIRISLVVNNGTDGKRAGYLEWGEGIAGDKDPSAYGELKPTR